MAAIGVICVLGLAVAGIIVAAQTAAGQDEPRAPVAPEAAAGPDQPAERAARPDAERRRGRPEAGDEARRRFDQEAARRFAGDMMMRQPPAIAVAEGKVFVVANGVLYKFDAETLAIEGQQRIPRPALPAELLRGRERGEPTERPGGERTRRDQG